MSRTNLLACCAPIVAWGVIVSMPKTTAAAAQTFDYVKIADENTVVPGTSGIPFGTIFPPALDGNTVAFMGMTAGPGDGVYKYQSGSLARVADESTVLPGVLDSAFSFGFAPSLDASDVAFAAETFSGHAIFKQTASGLDPVAVTGVTSIPEGQGTFASFFSSMIPDVSFDNGNVAFRGSGAGGQSGIYVDVSTQQQLLPPGLYRVVDRSSSVPNRPADSFLGLFQHSVRDTTVVFHARLASGGEGIYSAGIVGSGYALVELEFDNSIGTTLGPPSFDGAAYARFLEAPRSGQDIVLKDLTGATVRTVANTLSTNIPEGSGRFTNLEPAQVSFDNGSVAFLGRGSSGQEGIYTEVGGTLVKVVDKGDQLDGKQVRSVILLEEGFSDGNVGFFASLDSGFEGANYVAIQRHVWDAASGLWDTKTNWAFGGLPRNVVPTLITPDNGIVITGPANPASIRSLDIGALTSGVAQLNLRAGGHLTIDETLTVRAAGRIDVGGALVVRGGIVNDGVITGSGQVDGVLQNTAGGQVRTGSGARLLFTANNPNSNAGHMESRGG